MISQRRTKWFLPALGVGQDCAKTRQRTDGVLSEGGASVGLEYRDNGREVSIARIDIDLVLLDLVS